MNVVSVSGGKDSTAVILLALALEVEAEYVFADTGNEHSLTYDYLAYLESKLGIRIERLMWDWRKALEGHCERMGVDTPACDSPFLALALIKGRFPSMRARFCTEYLKIKPLEDYVAARIAESGHVTSWQGIRAEESAARAMRPYYVERSEAYAIYYPIFRWTAADVFEAHRYMNVEPNPLYRQGMKRVGCMPCINCSKKELREIGNRFPGEIARIADWEARVKEFKAAKGNERVVSTFFPAPKQKDIALSTHGIEAKVEWSRTAHGGYQADLFGSVFTECSSHYQLCE